MGICHPFWFPFDRAKLASFLVGTVCSIFALALLSGCDSTDHRTPVSSSDDTSSRSGSNDTNRGSAKRASASQVPVQQEPQVSDERKSVIQRSEALRAESRFTEAFDLLKTLLIADAEDGEVIFRMASLAAANGDLSTGIELLNEIPVEHLEAGLAAQGQAADWCLSLQRYPEAEKRYRTILDRVPNAVPVLRQLALLLNRQGRRQEASEIVRRLCLLGNVMQDELHSLIVIGDAMYDAPTDETIPKADPVQASQPRYSPISPYGDARLAFQNRRFMKAIELLKPSIENSTAPPSMVALFGRSAGEIQDDVMLAWWLERLHPQVTQFADYWATLGMLELMGQRYESATRAFGEAIQRDPTDIASISRMRQALASLGNDTEDQLWLDRWTNQRAAIDANNRVAEDAIPDPASVELLAKALDQLDRPLEALLWRATVSWGETGSQRMSTLKLELEELLANGKPFPDRSSQLCGLELQDYPLPDRAKLALSTATRRQDLGVPNDRKVIPASFADLADPVGMEHVYRVASQPQEGRFSIYQTLGGGVAILDYDLDGSPDLYFAQGASDPPDFQSQDANQLYRNVLTKVIDTTESANVAALQYSLGVTAGDWNQDGFPDLGVASIGACVLLVNNGDGTFHEQRLKETKHSNRAPASIAIADVTGDDLPDLIEIGYIDDPDLIMKPPVDAQGNVLITLGPNSFDPAMDHLFENKGDGSFAFRGLTDKDNARTGLGLVVGDFDSSFVGNDFGNEVFIGVDSLPNRLWKLESDGKQVDIAAVLGCAYGFSGGDTGAMGIAVGDFDQNSKMDLHVTNFENENSNLYLMKERSFEDRNRQFRLAEASEELVGFGTQSIDYDNDGDSDLIVANGHLDDAKSIRGNYVQPMQLFCNLGREFRLIDVNDPSGFWGQHHVGRAVATLDFNRDGQLDFVVTQIEMPSALLVNRTGAGHHWLQVALVGTTTERDAIGAQVEVQFDGKTIVQWNVAGDGYLCRNEPVVCFGLGEASRVDRLLVRWPDGRMQSFENVPVDQRVLVVESESSIFILQ